MERHKKDVVTVTLFLTLPVLFLEFVFLLSHTFMHSGNGHFVAERLQGLELQMKHSDALAQAGSLCLGRVGLSPANWIFFSMWNVQSPSPYAV